MTNQMITSTQQEVGTQPIAAYQNLEQTLAACQKAGQALQVVFKLDSPHHGTIMMLTCMSEGLTVSQCNKRYHGDGSMRASAIQAEFLIRGGMIEWVNLGDDGKLASATFSHPKLMKNPSLIKYTIEDAKRQVGDKMSKAGSNWLTNPGSMLRAALVRKAIKIIDPGIIGGYDDFNDLDDSPVNSSGTSTIDPNVAAARRAELERIDQEARAVQAQTDTGDVVDVDYEVDGKTVTSASTEATTQTAEEAPFTETAAAAEDPAPITRSPETAAEAKLCTNEQLTKIVQLGQKFESPTRKGEPMSLDEIRDGICEAAGVTDPSTMTHEQAEGIIANFTALSSGTQ